MQHARSAPHTPRHLRDHLLELHAEYQLSFPNRSPITLAHDPISSPLGLTAQTTIPETSNKTQGDRSDPEKHDDFVFSIITETNVVGTSEGVWRSCLANVRVHPSVHPDVSMSEDTRTEILHPGLRVDSTS